MLLQCQQVYEANQDITKKYRYSRNTGQPHQQHLSLHWMAKSLNMAKGQCPRSTSAAAVQYVAVPLIIDPDILPPSTTARKAR
jgi:hypothetical protein